MTTSGAVERHEIAQKFWVKTLFLKMKGIVKTPKRIRFLSPVEGIGWIWLCKVSHCDIGDNSWVTPCRWQGREFCVLVDGKILNFKNRNSEVLHSSSTLISLGPRIHESKLVGSGPIGSRPWRFVDLLLGCDELDESSNAKERVQFLLSYVCKEEFIFYCLKTQKQFETFHMKSISRDQRLQIVQDQLDQIIKVG